MLNRSENGGGNLARELNGNGTGMGGPLNKPVHGKVFFTRTVHVQGSH